MTDFAILDGDIIAYRAAAAGQKDLRWEDGETSTHVSLEDAIDAACQLVHSWTALSGARTPIVCLSSPVNFRKHLWPAYKANRAHVVRPQALNPVLEALEERFKSYRLHGLEADDAMGILATSDRFAGSVVVTLDKDLATVPGRHFSPSKDLRPRQVRPIMADRFWMLQVLTGDSGDGYPGCPGIGPKKAEAILAEAGLNIHDMWRAVVATYEARGQTIDDALMMARLARILRRPEYDRENQEIELWHPHKPVRMALQSLGENPPSPPKVDKVPSSPGSQRPKPMRSSARTTTRASQ